MTEVSISEASLPPEAHLPHKVQSNRQASFQPHHKGMHQTTRRPYQWKIWKAKQDGPSGRHSSSEPEDVLPRKAENRAHRGRARCARHQVRRRPHCHAQPQNRASVSRPRRLLPEHCPLRQRRRLLQAQLPFHHCNPACTGSYP